VYVIRRVYEVNPRTAREAATIAARIGELYHEAGRRSEVTVYFNGTTLPGETDVVYMQWTDDVIRSPSVAVSPRFLKRSSLVPACEHSPWTPGSSSTRC
jgi:hypothetical protein